MSRVYEKKRIQESKKGRFTLLDVFIVKQSSTHYWRVMYSNAKTQKYEYFAYRNTRIIAEYMVELYKNQVDGVEV